MAHTPISPSCQHTLLARSPAGQVSVCSDCKLVHLSMDRVSVRLDINAFLLVAQMLSQAHKHLNQMQTHEGHASYEPARVVH